MTSPQPARAGTTIPEQRRRPREIPRRAALLSGRALPLGLMITGAAPATARQPAPSRFTLPAPAGHHRPGTTSLDLIDTSRPDPRVPAQPFRELIIQLWYPAHAAGGYPRVPWMTPVTARACEQLYGYPVLPLPITSAYPGAPARQRRGGWPVVLYSPSLQGDREEATALAEDLASHGYVVVTIDHIHDADVAELPDGHAETSALPGDDLQETTKAIESRVAGVRLVLDQLAALSRGGNPGHEHRPLPSGLRGALDLDAAGMPGHSDGGATTAHAIHADPRITAGINLDGTLWTPAAVAGSGRPFLLFGRQDPGPFEASTRAAFRKNQRGPELQLNLTGSQHLTFTDLAVLEPQAAPIPGLSPARVIAGAGTISGQRAVTAERTYVSAWLDTYLRHHNSHLLTGPSPRYPEVMFASH